MTSTLGHARHNLILSIYSVIFEVTCWTAVLSHATVSTLCIDYLFIFPFFELLDKFCKRGELPRVNQIELINEIYEVLEAGVQMSLRRKQHYVLEVRVVNVSINSKKSFEYNFDDVREILGERYTESAREDLFIIKLVFYPCH